MGATREPSDPQYDSADAFRWNVRGSGVTIVELNNPINRVTDIRIPPFIQGKPVTRIGFNAFRNMNITSVSIPDSVTIIEDSAFENNCLTGVIIPSGVTCIACRAFSDNQLASVNIPDGVTTIEKEAFLNNQLESVRIPRSVRTIGNRAFEQNQLTSVVIPNGVTFIENSVFAFNLLTSVSIPNTVTHIGVGAFEENQLASLTIPSSVTNIEDRAFAWNWLANISIPDSVVSVGEDAFIQYDNEIDFTWKLSGDGNSVIITGQAGNRTRIRIPPEIQGRPVVEVGDFAFIGNHLHRRTTISIPETVITIGRDAFAHNHLTSVTIPGNVTGIGPGAFANNKLTAISLETGLKSIGGSHPQHGSGAFANNKLTDVSIPNSVTYIGDWAFSGNPLARIHVPASVTYIGKAFPYKAIISDVFAFAEGFLARLIDNGTAIRIIRYTGMEEDVRIPSHIQNLPVTVIGSGAFESGFAKWAVDIRTKSITIPATVIYIEREAFVGQKLTDIVIPDSVAYIGAMAFSGNHFNSISIGGDVTFLRWPPINDTTGGFGADFAAFYEKQGRKAGTYTYTERGWKAQLR